MASIITSFSLHHHLAHGSTAHHAAVCAFHRLQRAFQTLHLQLAYNIVPVPACALLPLSYHRLQPTLLILSKSWLCHSSRCRASCSWQTSCRAVAAVCRAASRSASNTCTCVTAGTDNISCLSKLDGSALQMHWHLDGCTNSCRAMHMSLPCSCCRLALNRQLISIQDTPFLPLLQRSHQLLPPLLPRSPSAPKSPTAVPAVHTDILLTLVTR